MNDLIDRQAALDEIDKNRQTLLSLGMNVEEYVLFHYCRRVIEDLPTIDAVPVVRCKDCRRQWGSAQNVRTLITTKSPGRRCGRKDNV